MWAFNCELYLNDLEQYLQTNDISFTCVVSDKSLLQSIMFPTDALSLVSIVSDLAILVEKPFDSVFSNSVVVDFLLLIA